VDPNGLTAVADAVRETDAPADRTLSTDGLRQRTWTKPLSAPEPRLTAVDDDAAAPSNVRPFRRLLPPEGR
jgi:hypothetical protein